MTTEQTPKEKLIAAMDALQLQVKSEFVPFSQSRNVNEEHRSLNWRVTLVHAGRDVLTTDYSAGTAHCPGYQDVQTVKDTHRVHALVLFETEHGKRGRYIPSSASVLGTSERIAPDSADVVYSLVQDANAIDEGSFEDWASSLGYDTDSRKAESIYRACVDIGLKLRAAIGEDGLQKLREASQDY